MNHSFRDSLGLWVKNIPLHVVTRPTHQSNHVLCDVVCVSVVTHAAASLGALRAPTPHGESSTLSRTYAESRNGMCQLSCHMEITAFSHKTVFLCTSTQLSLLLF